MDSKSFKISLYLLLIGLAVSCTNKNAEDQSTQQEGIIDYLPFQQLALEDLSDFQQPSENWVVGGDSYANRNEDRHLEAKKGKGVLLNLMTEENKGNLFTNFEHIDIDLEVDVMMPKGSNSGIYFQSRYEIQLFDSWGVDTAHYSDMGGIYQRWDDSQPEGREGYQGHNPHLNAAYAPGLWQHLKISFTAPVFDDEGNKLENARFNHVYLNGHLIHENVELTGPTRGAKFSDETHQAPIMIQGDHGPVAFKNFRYKLYDKSKISLSNLTVSEFESKDDSIGDYRKMGAKYSISTDSVSYMVSSVPQEFMLVYDGKIHIPTTGEYLLDFDIHNNTSGQLILADSMYFDIKRGSGGREIRKVELVAGEYPITLVYNHPYRIWAYSSKFTFYMEGPGIKRMPIHAPSSILKVNPNIEPIYISAQDEVIAQRTFVIFKNEKLTHSISIGTPQGYHYTIDLLTGSLVRMWAGEFMDATNMWHARGEDQLGIAQGGSVVELFRSPIVSKLSGKSADWPAGTNEDNNFKFTNYTLDEKGFPTFNYVIDGLTVSDITLPGSDSRELNRNISITGDTKDAWCKIGEGSSIELLPDGSYSIDDKSYYLSIQDADKHKVVVRNSNGKQELLVSLKDNATQINYGIIW